MEEEHEIEYISRARVHSIKGKKVNWEYFVKWKWHGLKDNTWEPPESFDGGSEHTLARFWELVNTEGRDINDSSMFVVGEEVLPGFAKSHRKEVKMEHKAKANHLWNALPPTDKGRAALNDFSGDVPIGSGRTHDSTLKSKAHPFQGDIKRSYLLSDPDSIPN